MKSEDLSKLLEDYLDGELETAEQELFARYDRGLEVSPFLWTRVAAHTVAENHRPKRWAAVFARPLASVIAALLLAIAVGIVYLISRRPEPNKIVADSGKPAPTQPKNKEAENKPEFVAAQPKPKPRVKPATRHVAPDQSDVLSSDLAYLDIDEQDTARHIEQTQNLLRSIRNVPTTDGDEEIDVTYDKQLSRRLLNENVVLRRDAEMKAKFPAKTLLTDLEPFLIDIANLPDHARPEDVRAIKERVQKTEIVAALLVYQDRGTNNR
ncbi:MAG TPA: hypothetical protein VGP59_03900 [Pyrinomonadaceae bacterium]|nr:hypothetical protein [Pyrinomonadaceae bacterium]